LPNGSSLSLSLSLPFRIPCLFLKHSVYIYVEWGKWVTSFSSPRIWNSDFILHSFATYSWCSDSLVTRYWLNTLGVLKIQGV
jgi:hypothetical protein